MILREITQFISRACRKVMVAYCRVYSFGHLQADCRGPELVPEPYARLEYGTTFCLSLPERIMPCWVDNAQDNEKRKTACGRTYRQGRRDATSVGGGGRISLLMLMSGSRSFTLTTDRHRLLQRWASRLRLCRQQDVTAIEMVREPEPDTNEPNSNSHFGNNRTEPEWYAKTCITRIESNRTRKRK